ncbi:bifunctional ClpP [Babesia duncani]|uniref:ATP-dependent Clp protease proteolytic subunit n=1 Tax=Babesia duncani TaxID=323732 RepID=A0AAD9UQL8_9APIC|nr:bifunctional ClpP [Babesia duncani]
MDLSCVLCFYIALLKFVHGFRKSLPRVSVNPGAFIIANSSTIPSQSTFSIQNTHDNKDLTTKEQYDVKLDEFMMNNRSIFLTGELNDDKAHQIVLLIMRMNGQDPNAPIKFYINSPGGSVTAGMAIYDLLQSLKMPVETICLGQAASMGAFLLASGTKGKRCAMPNSRIMIHQPLGGAHGQASDIEIQANEILQTREMLNAHLAHFTGKNREQIEKDCDRDNYMRPTEALDYGIIDYIITTKTSHLDIPRVAPLEEI